MDKSVKVYLTGRSLPKSLLLISGVGIVIYFMLMMLPEVEKNNFSLPIIESYFDISNEKKLIYFHFFTGLLFLLLLQNIFTLILILRKKHCVSLFENKMIFPISKTFLYIKIVKTVYYKDIQFAKLECSKILPIKLWILSICTSDGKEYLLRCLNKRKEKILEIYDFIKERIPPEALNPPPENASYKLQ